ncbi:glycoside hydrolase domain-containing protein [Halalkalibacter krulwichiae]|uniref:Rv2525c-like glycoside hydrolase-like domain-containing protein n=1 Tax=Halalkalibacter krulwichiae TaxID=199441 RepID=A0A1X9MB09_9BACI|nr:glycoside hydrolase domain-containing protein [Halalkalibacter krulwichiae]ARK30606.1 hypothetical protein BkAM31D_12630 [Halalkalibacter krulwichiae]
MNQKNRSFLLLGVVSLLFIFTLTFFSQVNSPDSTPVLADQESQENDSNNNEAHTASNGDSLVNNQITNEISASGGEIHNNIDNSIKADEAEVDNTIDNKIVSGENNIVDNNVTNQIDVNIGVNVTNSITNDITAHKTDKESETENDENNDESENGENGNGSDDGNGEDTPDTVWGVDSASLTTEEMLACVRDNFGDPQVWGRYLGTNEGVSYGLTEEEIELLQSNDIQILVIWNHFTDGTGYENGQNEATEAVETARDLGIPEGVALFANVEPIYPIDSSFIQGWHDVVSESEYSSGIYGIFDPSEELYVAFEAAAEENSSILDEMYIWTAAPNEGITTEDNAPDYNPEYPDGGLIGGWQYGIDAETCNIDTNIFDGNVLEVLW